MPATRRASRLRWWCCPPPTPSPRWRLERGLCRRALPRARRGGLCCRSPVRPLRAATSMTTGRSCPAGAPQVVTRSAWKRYGGLMWSRRRWLSPRERTRWRWRWPRHDSAALLGRQPSMGWGWLWKYWHRGWRRRMTGQNMVATPEDATVTPERRPAAERESIALARATCTSKPYQMVHLRSSLHSGLT